MTGARAWHPVQPIEWIRPRRGDHSRQHVVATRDGFIGYGSSVYTLCRNSVLTGGERGFGEKYLPPVRTRHLDSRYPVCQVCADTLERLNG